MEFFVFQRDWRSQFSKLAMGLVLSGQIYDRKRFDFVIEHHWFGDNFFDLKNLTRDLIEWLQPTVVLQSTKSRSQLLPESSGRWIIKGAVARCVALQRLALVDPNALNPANRTLSFSMEKSTLAQSNFWRYRLLNAKHNAWQTCKLQIAQSTSRQTWVAGEKGILTKFYVTSRWMLHFYSANQMPENLHCSHVSNSSVNRDLTSAKQVSNVAKRQRWCQKASIQPAKW